MIKNTQTQFGLVAKSFHWLMALLFITMFTIAYIMINIPKSDFRLSLYDFHKATGVLLFALVSLRIMWRFINVQPPLPATTSFWQRMIAHSNIFTLYSLMFLMPLTGFFTSTLSGHTISFYGIFIIPSLANTKVISTYFTDAHYYLSWLMVACFVLHLLGALYHHYFLKDDVLTRMTKTR